MDEISPVAVAAVAVVVVVGAVPALALVGPALATPTDAPGDGATAAADSGNASLAPGERLAAVVGVQRAELDGEVTARAFARQVATAASNDSKARVVGVAVENISERLAQLSAAKRELVAAHENGSIGTGQYRAQLAQIHARQRTLQRLANRTEAVAAGLPEATLAANGVNVTAIGTLRSEARNLTGPDVAAVARSIAGRGVGNGIGLPGNRGPPEDRGAVDDLVPGLDGNETDGNETGDERGPPDDRGPPEDRGSQDNESERADGNESDEPDDEAGPGERGENGDGERGENGDGERGDGEAESVVEPARPAMRTAVAVS